MWRCAVLEGFEQMPELLLSLIIAQAKKLEYFGLDVAAVDTGWSLKPFRSR